MNNPLGMVDPDGKEAEEAKNACPTCIVSAAAAAMDMVVQVGIQMIMEGKGWEDVDIDEWSVIGAASAGFVGVGIAEKTRKFLEISPKLIRSPQFKKVADWMINQVKDIGIDGLASAIDQYISSGEIKPENIVVDVTAGRLASAGANSLPIPASKKANQRVSQAEEQTRIERRNRSANPDRSRSHLNTARREQTRARTTQSSSQRSRRSAVTVAGSGTAGDIYQANEKRNQ